MGTTKSESTIQSKSSRDANQSTPIINTEYENIYLEDLSLIKASTPAKYFRPSIRYYIYLEEAEGFYEVLMRKLQELKAEGFKQETADLYYRRIASARVAQAVMTTYIDEQRISNSTFKELYPEAETLRERLFDRIKFIVSDDPNRKSIIKDISKGSRIGDTLQDLLELGKLGESLLPQLKEINVTTEEINRAKELATTLGRIHKASNIDGKVHSESRIIRDKAITLFNESLAEIRDWAKLVYKHDKQTRMQFFSQQMRLNSQQKRTQKIKEVEIKTASSEDSEAV